MRYGLLRRQDALLVREFLRSTRSSPFCAAVHNDVEKRESEFSLAVNAESSISCIPHFWSDRLRTLHQQSALTIINEVFTFAPVDG
jgi:hypothetical protein